MSRIRSLLVPLVAVATLVPSMSASAAPGDVDTSFSPPDGKVTTDIAGGADEARDILLVGRGGKVVLVGDSRGPTSDDFALVRYLRNGQVDTSFGTNGAMTTDFFGGDDGAWAAALLPKNRILAVGWAETPTGDYDIAVARYRGNGSPDPRFGGGDGKVTVPVPHEGYAYGVVPTEKGKFVVVGESYQGGTPQVDDWVLVGFKKGGALDNRFGDQGIRVLDFAGGGDGAFAAMGTDRGIVVTGWAMTSPYDGTGPQPDYVTAVARFRPNGNLDRRFGDDGVRFVDASPGNDWGVALAAGTRDRIVVAARATTSGNPDFGLYRLRRGGSLEARFGGGDGITTQDFGSDENVTDVAVQGRKLVVAAYRDNDMAVARFGRGGGLDTGFGTNGLATVDFAGGFDRPEAVAVQSGRILLAGGADMGATDLDFAAVRLIG